ncbi:MAG: hypothetical protein ACKO3C_03755 [Betaproteobacteria bacterium]
MKGSRGCPAQLCGYYLRPQARQAPHIAACVDARIEASVDESQMELYG